MTDNQIVEPKPVEQALVRQDQQTTTLTPAEMLSIAVQQGADTQKLKELMDLQERYQRDQARKAYAEAIVHFRSACPTIKRTGSANYGQGKTTYTYAQLPQAIEQIQALMSECQLAVTWRTPAQTPTWIEVECTVTHVLGHAETTKLGGPPDTSGSKNQLQAIKSAWSYLRRTTLFSLLGLVDKDEVDDDGAGGKPTEPPKADTIADPEAADKRRFWEEANAKAGKQLTGDQIRCVFAQVKEWSGATTAVECVEFLLRPTIAIAPDGAVYDNQSSAAATGSQTPDSPLEPATQPPPPSMQYQCDECLTTYPVKTAGGKCLTKGCLGRVQKIQE